MPTFLRGLRIYVHCPTAIRNGPRIHDWYERDCAHLEGMGAVVVSDPRDGPLAAILVFTRGAPRFGYKYTLGYFRAPNRPPTEWPLTPFLQRYGHVPILQRPWVYECLKAKRALLDHDDWGGWRIKLISYTALSEEPITGPPSSSLLHYRPTERYVPSDSPLARKERGGPRSRSTPPRARRPPHHGGNPTSLGSRQGARSRSPDPKRLAGKGKPSMERPREQRLPRSSEREPCEIRPSSSESHVTPASCASRCGSPNADRLHPGQPQDPHPSLRPRVLQIHTLGSHLAHLTPTLSSVASTDDERRPVANTDTLAAPRAGCSTSVTAQLNARTSFEAAHSAAHPLSANEAGSSLATVAFTPEPPTNGSASVSYRPWETTTVVANLDGPAPVDCRDSLKHHAHATKPPRQPEISLSNTAIDSRSPSPPHSIIDLTTSPEPNRGPSSSPIAPDSSLSPGSSCLTLPNFPPIFIIGSHQLQFHVLPSSGRPWVEQAITWGGGAIAALQWAEYVVCPPDTLTRDVWDYEAVRSPGARLVRPAWVFESMVTAKMLDPSAYEVS